MKISKVIEHCDKCQFAKRFNYTNANIGCVFVCMKSARMIIHDKEVSHFSNIEPLDIPDWCEMEEYTGVKISRFLMKMEMNRIAQAKYISSL